MFKGWLAQALELNLQIVGLLIFFVVFVVMFIWTFRASGKPYYQRMEHLPFEGEGQL